MTSLAIEVEALSKLYYLGGRRPPRRSLRERLRKLAGRPVPNELERAVAEDRAFWALRGVDLAVPRGEVLGIIGRNGAGKSTLLKILSRITAPSRGQAVISGSMVSLLEVGTGFHEELSGRENIYLNGTLLGMKRQEIEAKLDEIVAFSGIERFLNTPVKHYSSGMRVRLGFSVAAHVEPDILVIDEVLAVGDMAFQEKCLKKMDALTHDLGRTVLFVSHSMAAVLSLCERSIRLDQGMIVDDGPSGEVIGRYHGQVVEAGGRVELGRRNDRTGSGLLRFTGLHLEDPLGRRMAHAVTGGPVSIVLDYECDRAFTGPADTIVNIVVSNTRGMRLFGLPTDAMRQTNGELFPRGRFVCRLPELPLLPGSYDVDIACIRNRELVDKIMGAGTIVVAEGDPYGTGGLPHPHYGDVVTRYAWTYEAALDPERMVEPVADIEKAAS